MLNNVINVNGLCVHIAIRRKIHTRPFIHNADN